MKKLLKISRSNFHNVGNFSWINYFIEILNLKYEVVIDSENPDIVIYSNLFYIENEIDYFTKKKIRGIGDYSSNVKKIFISGEANPGYHSHLTRGENNYVLGYEHIEHDRYLRFPTYVLDAYVLHNEGGLFENKFGWLTQKRDARQIFYTKKYFCSIVQNSFNEDRKKLCDIIEKKYWIKASGAFKNTVSPEETLNTSQYHNYSNPNYIGKIDGLVYRDKIKFFEDCFFNIAFQYTDTDHLTQEKIIHAFAANTIPIFWGNRFIENEGFNPDSFVNCHKFQSLEDVFSYLDELINDKTKMVKMLGEPFFIDNKLPIYFDEEYLLNFLEKIIEEK